MAQYLTIDQAIAQFEGYNTLGTIANRQNNPGAIVYNDWSQSHGAVAAGTNGIAIFPNAETGFAAEDALVSNYADRGYTISDLINAWTPPDAPGNSQAATDRYVNYVASQAGVNPSTPVSAVGSGSSVSNSPSILDQLKGAASDTGSALLNSTFPWLPVLGTSWSRVALFILGLIVIVAGLYQFKPVQNIVTTGARTAKTALLAA